MFNRLRTIEVYGYDIDPDVRRRTASEIDATNGISKKRLLVIDNCPSCGVERNIKLRQSRKNKPCSKCFHNSPAMIEAKINQTKIKSEETKRKMSESHFSKRGIVNFKGHKHTKEAKDTLRKASIEQFASYSEEYKLELRKKGSCTARGITLEDFDGFSSPKATLIRQSAEGKIWIKEVLSKSNFTCEKCNIRGGSLHAHHKNAFNLFPEQRFDIANGACLCVDCHNDFHNLHGKGNNTKEQYHSWLSKPKPVIYLICGVSGAGKSWVCKQLVDKFHYVSFDGNPKKKHLELLSDPNISKPILHDLPIKISTFIKRNAYQFDIKPIFIVETQEVIEARLKARGGEWTESAAKRMQAIDARNKKYGVFSGTADEVLAYLLKV